MPAASGIKGVYKRQKKWKAEARRPGDRRRHLGTYETKELAAEAVAAYMRGEEVGNRARTAQSGYKGVYPSGKKFVAQGHRPSEGSHYLGTFEDLESAAAAVEAWERGEDAGLQPRVAASGIKGVYQSGSKWRAQGRRPGEKQRHLGSFATKEEAAAAVAAHKAGADRVTEEAYGGILVMSATPAITSQEVPV
jgi:hypothetical protein